MNQTVHAIVLAAGKSSRFGTGQTKQLVPVCGVPMVRGVVDLLISLHVPTTVVLGHQSAEVKAVLEGTPTSYAYQQEQHGTGSAVAAAVPLLAGDHVLIVNGDLPLLTQSLLSSLLYTHAQHGADLTLCTTLLEDATGYGRIVTSPSGVEIREEKECSDEERAITIVNAGIYVVERSFLEQALAKLKPSSQTGERYITDIVGIASAYHKKVYTHRVPSDLVRGVNTLHELAVAEELLYERIRHKWQQHGVRLMQPSSIFIERSVRIGRGSVIEPGVHLRGRSLLGKQVTVGAYSVVTDCVLDDAVTVYSHSVLADSHVAHGAQIGPFARLRGHNEIGQESTVGCFVELKSTHFGRHVKAKHLSYLGDATVGSGANIGAGAITANYDGQHKHHTRIGNNALIGANSSLVAPISIGQDAYVAAGSALTKDVPRGALGIGRARQVIKNEWTRTRRLLGAVRSREHEHE